MDKLKLLEEVEVLSPGALREYIGKRAELICSNTQGECWGGSEDWIIEAVELAHAVVKLLRE